jgi:hypothetical protein
MAGSECLTACLAASDDLQDPSHTVEVLKGGPAGSAPHCGCTTFPILRMRVNR